jgi:excisionase family DNA binding protein
MLSLEFVAFRSRVHAPVMQAEVTASADSLLTVKDAAVRLRVSTASVYALCGRGELAHVRASTHSIRIREQDLAEFIRARATPCRR